MKEQRIKCLSCKKEITTNPGLSIWDHLRTGCAHKETVPIKRLRGKNMQRIRLITLNAQIDAQNVENQLYYAKNDLQLLRNKAGTSPKNKLLIKKKIQQIDQIRKWLEREYGTK